MLPTKIGLAGSSVGTLGEIWQGPWLKERSGLPKDEIAVFTVPSHLTSVVRILGRANGISPMTLPPKSRRAAELLFAKGGVDSSVDDWLWEVKTDLVSSKGMSSSTADIVATLRCAARLLKTPLPDSMVLEILAKIERSDPVFSATPEIFLTSGHKFVKTWAWRPRFVAVYALLPGEVHTEMLDTQELLSIYREHSVAYTRSLALLESSMASESIEGVLKAATQSALLCQTYLQEPVVEQLTELSIKNPHAGGVFRAHTGKLVGTLHPADVTSDTIELTKTILIEHGLNPVVTKTGY